LQCTSTGNEVVTLETCIDAVQNLSGVCLIFAESHASLMCLQAKHKQMARLGHAITTRT